MPSIEAQSKMAAESIRVGLRILARIIAGQVLDRRTNVGGFSPGNGEGQDSSEPSLVARESVQRFSPSISVARRYDDPSVLGVSYGIDLPNAISCQLHSQTHAIRNIVAFFVCHSCSSGFMIKRSGPVGNLSMIYECCSAMPEFRILGAFSVRSTAPKAKGRHKYHPLGKQYF